MLRASTAANAAHVILDIKPGGSVEFMKRSSTGGSTSYLAGASQPPPTWLKMVRSGSTVTGYVSSNGSTWTTVGSTTVSIGSSALAGLAVTSHNTSVLNTSTFDNVTVGAGATAANLLPSEWEAGDIGPVGRSGSASYADSTFTVSGAGADIWGASDSFHYVYQPVSGDSQIAARVASVENTHRYAKAGVMLRESLDADAAHVILDVTPGGGVEFMERSSAGESTTFIAGSSQTPPAWLSLVRSGSTVTGYVSANGSSWTMVDSTTLSIGSSAFAGLAVTSHDTSVLNTSTFDNVALNP